MTGDDQRPSLLARYIEHVDSCEGSTFLSDYCRDWSKVDGVEFTDEEWAELQRLGKETPDGTQGGE